MKNNLFLILFLIISNTLFAQNSPDCFRISFTDKANTPYSIQHPEAFLSPRAIEKRSRFSIPITEQDLPVNSNYISQVLSVNNTNRLLSKSKWNNSIVIYCKDETALFTINNLPFVSEVTPVAYYDKLLEPQISSQDDNLLINSDELVSKSTNDYDYGGSIGQIAIHNGQYLHQLGFQGNNMLIAVLDAGWLGFDQINYFNNLYASGQIWGAVDLMPESNNVYYGHTHGTSVTSIMGSSIDGSLVGTAPQANYFFIRSENPWSEQPIEEDYWAQGAELADSLGADVINSSLGYTTFVDFPEDTSTYQNSCNGIKSIASRAATIAVQKGIIVVVSAGNEGASGWHYISRPADAFEVLTVGAVNSDTLLAPFSSYGPSADGRVKPDVCSVGWDTWVVYSDGNIWPGSGTSFSGPVISGLCACLWQALPDKSSSQIIQLVRENTHLFSTPNDSLGFGIPNFYQIYLDHFDDKIESFNQTPLAVYPNPTSSFMNVNNFNSLIKQIFLYDITGRQIAHYYIDNRQIITINLTAFPQGVYFGKAIGDQYMGSFKVIKQ